MATLFSSFWILFLGRVVSGIATSLLFSVFESWLVNEHNAVSISSWDVLKPQRGFNQEQLSHIFSVANFGNGVVAILAGMHCQNTNFLTTQAYLHPLLQQNLEIQRHMLSQA